MSAAASSTPSESRDLTPIWPARYEGTNTSANTVQLTTATAAPAPNPHRMATGTTASRYSAGKPNRPGT
jgi:hypothetical protein